MERYRLLCGDAREQLATLDAGSVQTCITSPPYWALRDYGTGAWEGGAADCDHQRRQQAREERPRGALEGSMSYVAAQEPAYREACGKCGAWRVDRQMGLEATPEKYLANMVEVFRGVWRVLRDDGTLWVNMGDCYVGSSGSGGRNSFQSSNAGSFHDAAVREAYGLAPKNLMGMPWRLALALQADGWILRSSIIWSKPNPMPESVTDRPTKAHEDLFLLAKQGKYFYDAEAVREAAVSEGRVVEPYASDAKSLDGVTGTNDRRTARGIAERGFTVGANRNRRDVWSIASEAFPGAHFATFPQELVKPCVLAGSREGDLILDPFAGSGTAGVVALKYGRRFVGIDINPEYLEMARRRLDGIPLTLMAEAR